MDRKRKKQDSKEKHSEKHSNSYQTSNPESSLNFTDKKRKEEEIKNSTTGGF